MKRNLFVLVVLALTLLVALVSCDFSSDDGYGGNPNYGRPSQTQGREEQTSQNRYEEEQTAQNQYEEEKTTQNQYEEEQTTQNQYEEEQTTSDDDLPVTGEMVYESFRDGTCCLKSVGTYTGKVINIPETSPAGDRVIGIEKKAFQNCERIRTINLPSTLTYIGDYAFQECINLQEITIPKNVVSIGYQAFSGCVNLQKLYFNATECKDFSSGNPVFQNAGQKSATGLEVYIADNVKQIPDYFMFSNSQAKENKITKAVFAEGSVCESIGKSAFEGCRGMSSVNIPASMITIDNDAFCGCESITEITIPKDIVSIGYRAFSGCVNLQKLYFNATECKDFSSGNPVFRNAGQKSATGLEVYIADNVKQIPDYFMYANHDTEFNNVVKVHFESGSRLLGISTGAFLECYHLAEIVWPTQLEIIESYAFSKCGMNDLVLPSCVEEIQGHAFEGCENITELDLPSGLRIIGAYAFSDCVSVQKLTIKANTKEIGNRAFGYLFALTEIHYYAVNCNNVNKGTFIAAGKRTDGVKVSIYKSVRRVPNNLLAFEDSDYFNNISNVWFERGSICEEIGKDAFSYCKTLTDVYLDRSIYDIINKAISFALCPAVSFFSHLFELLG